MPVPFLMIAPVVFSVLEFDVPAMPESVMLPVPPIVSVVPAAMETLPPKVKILAELLIQL